MSISLPINRLFKEPLATISELRVRSISLTTPSGIVQVVVEATNKIPKGGVEQELFFSNSRFVAAPTKRRTTRIELLGDKNDNASVAAPFR